MTLYNKIGGQATVEKIVDEFHKRILADKSVKGFFARTDMAKQRNHQIAFFTQILGGPSQYTGRPMDKTHTGLKLQQPHFDTVVKHLGDAITASGTSAEDTKAALASVAALKDSILNK
jgi:hemoglobin